MMQRVRVVRVRGSSRSYCVYLASSLQPPASSQRRGQNSASLPGPGVATSHYCWLVCSWSTEEYRVVVRTSWLREIQNRFRVRFGEYWALYAIATAPFAPIRWRW